MAESRQVIKLKVPDHWDQSRRESFGREAVRVIRDRTERGIDRNGKMFKHYSDLYANSRDFKTAGKSKSHVNLRLTGEMMATLGIVSHRRGEVNIGFNPNRGSFMVEQ